MTTKPKARKFRIRRTGGPEEGEPTRPAAPPSEQPASRPVREAAPEAERRPASPPPPTREGQVSPAQPREGQVSSAQEMSVDGQIDAIRKEGLTGRQLRMARRVAQKHGLAPTSDFDAVRLLRAAGIDPFQRATMLELVVPENQHELPNEDGEPGQPAFQIATTQVPADKVQLPQTVPSGDRNLPSTEVNPAERRASEIYKIQRDIARRRRRKLALLMTRLAFFVFLPTVICGWYFYNIATPMYSTKAEFLVLQADAQGGGGLGGLLTGTQFATNQDSIATQSYLQSRDAMQRLDADTGFKAHFSQDMIDPVQRLDPDASDEAAYKLFKKNVKIGYDPTEGVIRMEVIAANPDVSADFSNHLIDYAEERVDDLSREKREDQMKDARASLENAKKERREAQEALIKLQEGSLLDPEGEIGSIRSLIGSLEAQLVEKQLELNSQLSNSRPNRAKVDSLRTEINLLENELQKQNNRLTDATEGDDSLARKAALIQMAQADLATADVFLQSALQNMKQTELEANRQVRYLSVSVKPVATDEAAYPRKFENTILAFLIFAGIYLMVSLTSSILREQVSS